MRLQDDRFVFGEKVRRERRWTSAGETCALELVRSTAAPIPNHAPATAPRTNHRDFPNTHLFATTILRSISRGGLRKIIVPQTPPPCTTVRGLALGQMGKRGLRRGAQASAPVIAASSQISGLAGTSIRRF
jgi:hypothetical protein